MKYIHNDEKILKEFREIVDHENSSIRRPVKLEYQDRLMKIDTHIIWSIVMHFSAKEAKEKNPILALIGEYYSIFHCCFSIVCLDLKTNNVTLRRMKHSKLSNLLKSLVNHDILNEKILDLFDDSRHMREYVNYLAGKTGLDKFKSLRNFKLYKTISYGTTPIDCFLDNIMKDAEDLLNEFVSLVKRIETDKDINSYLFGFLHMKSDFDYYGEDFLDGFFTEENLKIKIWDFLRGLDEDQ